MTKTRLTWRWFFFSPKGRFNRGRYWGATFLVYGVMALFVVPLAVMDAGRTGKPISDGAGVFAVVAVVMLVAMSIAHIFTTIKRFHDRDKAWPWILVGLIPYIGGLWIFVECGCLGGTRGRNRFGADPLNPDEDDILSVFDAPTHEPRLAAQLEATPQDRIS